MEYFNNGWGFGFVRISSLTDRLMLLGHRITVIDDLSTTGNLDNIKHWFTDPNFNFIQGDIVDLSSDSDQKPKIL